MTASTTTIVCADLDAFGDDFFNDRYYIQVLNDADGTDNEGVYRPITDYASATGTFTVEAFAANVEELDTILVLHESLVGRVLAHGTLTTSSATVPADTGRGEANDFWNGKLLCTTWRIKATRRWQYSLSPKELTSMRETSGRARPYIMQ